MSLAEPHSRVAAANSPDDLIWRALTTLSMRKYCMYCMYVRQYSELRYSNVVVKNCRNPPKGHAHNLDLLLKGLFKYSQVGFQRDRNQPNKLIRYY